jgi:3-oxoacyl-(acyl-carrier-protein) synthase
MVAGGTEASLNEIAVCAFLRAQALSTKVCWFVCKLLELK